MDFIVRRGRSMKIGVDARGAIWYRGTGIGTYTFQLIRQLQQLPTPHSFRWFWPGDEFKGLDPTQDEPFQTLERYKERFWEEVHIPLRLSQERIDVYHVPQNGIGLPGKKKCPLVVTVHDLIPYLYPETVGRSYLKIFLQEMPRIIEQADRIITVSEHSKRDIQHIFQLPEERLRVIAEAPEEMYRPMEKGRAKRFMQERYGIEGPYILYVGGFSPRKNVHGLIHAFFALLRDLDPRIVLVIAGKKVRDFEETALLVEALGLSSRVIFPGFVPVGDMPYLYNAAELFVYPSFYEGFGLPPLEAMACGIPVICSRTSALPEVCGDGAYLVNPYQPHALAEAIHLLMAQEELRHFFAERGQRRAAAFSWRQAALETLAVYEELAGKES